MDRNEEFKSQMITEVPTKKLKLDIESVGLQKIRENNTQMDRNEEFKSKMITEVPKKKRKLDFEGVGLQKICQK